SKLFVGIVSCSLHCPDLLFCWRPSERYQTWKDCNRYTALRRVVLCACQWSANAITFAVERVVSRALRRRLQSDLRFGSLPHLASHTPLQQGICTRLGWAACKSERLVSGSHSPGLFTDANFRLHSPLGADQFRRAECVSSAARPRSHVRDGTLPRVCIQA